MQDRHSKKLVGTGHREGSLFILECLHLPFFALSVSGLANPPSLFYLWHYKLGHVSSSHLKYMLSSGLLGNVPYSDICNCKGCHLAKFKALPFCRPIKSFIHFYLIHSDIWDLSPIPSSQLRWIRVICMFCWWFYTIITGYIWWNIDQNCCIFMQNFPKWLRLNLVERLKSLDLIHQVNKLSLFLLIYLLLMAL